MNWRREVKSSEIKEINPVREFLIKVRSLENNIKLNRNYGHLGVHVLANGHKHYPNLLYDNSRQVFYS